MEGSNKATRPAARQSGEPAAATPAPALYYSVARELAAAARRLGRRENLRDLRSICNSRRRSLGRRRG